MKENEITNDILSNLYYDETSPTCLRWGVKIADKINIHDRAGTTLNPSSKTDANSIVKVRGKGYRCSRIVWTMHHGEIPEGMIIDHLDGNPFNNAIKNLACKTHGENMRNRKICKKNTSGFTGVRWVCFKNKKHTYAEGTSSLHGKMTTKKFSVAKFGLLPAFKMAVLWRLSRMGELNELGLKYTDRHITAGLNVVTGKDSTL